MFRVVVEYKVNWEECHACLMGMARAVGEAGDACMGVSGCHCATARLPFDVVFERRGAGKVVRHVQCQGLDAFEVKVLRWLWRELCIGALAELGEEEGGKKSEGTGITREGPDQLAASV